MMTSNAMRLRREREMSNNDNETKQKSKPSTITLRRLEREDVIKPGDFTLNEIYNPDALDADDLLEPYYREVSPIPDGFEACDMADATKVLIGGTWCDAGGFDICIGGLHMPMRHFNGLGVLAIRPIPEPVQTPLAGEAKVFPFKETESYYGWVQVPKDLIGKVIRWEEVVKDGGE